MSAVLSPWTGPEMAGVQSNGYINSLGAVYCGNHEGYLCGPQQHDSSGQH